MSDFDEPRRDYAEQVCDAAPDDFWTSGWTELLPDEATNIYLRACAVSVLAPEDVERLLADLPQSEREAGLTRPLELVAAERCQLARLASAAGVAAPQTALELGQLLVTVGLLACDGDDIAAVVPVPLPDEVLALSAFDRRRVQRSRWRSAHADTIEVVLDLLEDLAGGESESEHRLWLAGVATDTDRDQESVRHALALLCEEPGMTADCDIERISAGETFTVSVNWHELWR